MDQSCSRCHQTVQEEYCFCPNCGLPQLVYPAENGGGDAQGAGWAEAVRDRSQVQWKPALRALLPLALAAGVLCAVLSPEGLLGLLLMGTAGAWAVTLYVRGQRPGWITVGAGARIGLVCGILAAGLAFTANGCQLFAKRYLFHQGIQIDADWKKFVDLDMQVSQQFTGWIGGPNSAEVQAQETQQKDWMLSPEGHAGIVVANFAFASFLLVLFAMAGGALSARMLVRTRVP